MAVLVIMTVAADCEDSGTSTASTTVTMMTKADSRLTTGPSAHGAITNEYA